MQSSSIFRRVVVVVVVCLLFIGDSPLEKDGKELRTLGWLAGKLRIVLVDLGNMVNFQKS